MNRLKIKMMTCDLQIIHDLVEQLLTSVPTTFIIYAILNNNEGWNIIGFSIFVLTLFTTIAVWLWKKKIAKGFFKSNKLDEYELPRFLNKKTIRRYLNYKMGSGHTIQAITKVHYTNTYIIAFIDKNKIFSTMELESGQLIPHGTKCISFNLLNNMARVVNMNKNPALLILDTIQGKK